MIRMVKSKNPDLEGSIQKQTKNLTICSKIRENKLSIKRRGLRILGKHIKYNINNIT